MVHILDTADKLFVFTNQLIEKANYWISRINVVNWIGEVTILHLNQLLHLPAMYLLTAGSVSMIIISA